jgi:hypothetical protein
VSPAPGPRASPPLGERSCCVLIVELVGYSRQPADEQLLMKDLLDERLGRALEGILPVRRVALDTAGGMALCLRDGPAPTLAASIRLVRLLQPHAAGLPVRMGLHAGALHARTDVDQHPSASADVIHVARRIMDLAQAGQLLASEEFLACHARLTGTRSPLFRYLGPVADRHGCVHDLHALELAASGPAGPRQAGSRPLPLTYAQIMTLEALLTEHLGPMARMHMRSRIEGGLESAALVEALSRLLPEGAVRGRFLQQALRALAPVPARAAPASAY